MGPWRVLPKDRPSIPQVCNDNSAQAVRFSEGANGKSSNCPIEFFLTAVRQARGDLDAVPNSAAKSLIDGMINTAQDTEYTEMVVKSALGSMYAGQCIFWIQLRQGIDVLPCEAGSDTVGGTLRIFILAMLLHPEIQCRIRDSIDNVCQGRLPNFSDYDRLPYVHAAIRESLRWSPVVMLSMSPPRPRPKPTKHPP